MAKQRNGRSGRTGRGPVDTLDRHGQSLLLWLWSLIVGSLHLALNIARETLQWYRKRRRSTRLCVLAVAAGLAFLWWRHQAPVYEDDAAEALARVVRSEVGVGSQQQQLHVAWATRNLAESRGETIPEMVCSPCGAQGRGRPVSSRQEAHGADRVLAARVMDASDVLDPTGGATHFVNPRLQDRLAKKGRHSGYRGNGYKKVRKRWRESYGWEPYYRLGPDLEFWGPKREKRRGRNKRP